MRLVLIMPALLALNFNFLPFQNDTFSGDPALYTEELSDFMRNISDEEEDLLDAFVDAWEKDSIFTATEQENIILLSQMMKKRNAKPTPHFVEFLSLMLTFKQSDIAYENYTNWVEGFKYVLDKRRTKTSLIINLLRSTNNLIRDNLIYKSSSTAWKATSPDYSILFDEGIYFKFNFTDLICYAKRDSMHLFSTKGIVSPAENKWTGEEGLITWERGGYDRNDVFATLKEYEIDLTKSQYRVENVVFTNKHYFDETLEGYIEDKVKINKTPEQATYPKFFSYTKEFEIKDFYEDMNYRGGLSMQGAKLVGTGTRENTAQVEIFRNDTLVLVANSVFFGFKADRVSSQQTSVTIKLKNDSIFHPDRFFSYRVRNRELSLMKTENFTSQGPYFNSYHKVDMDFDQLLWNMDEDFMIFTAKRGASVGNAYFESVNYFNYEKFLNMQMMDRVHPLISLRSFSRRYGSEEFPIQEFADYLKMPLHLVKQMAMRMAFNGFVYYDQNTELVTIKPRLHDYLAASVNKIDYDVIGIPSTVEAPLENAVFDLTNFDLTINGIPKIQVSDSQNVVIYPNNEQIILKYNRNFQFDGKVEAGLLTFYGNNFFFNYDSFKVNLQNVDSLNILYLTGSYDNFGLPRIAKVQNKLQHVTGEVLIDKSDNKSGRKSNPEYPIFKSKESSYVYFDRGYIEGGVYESSDFFFEVYPFEMDSLDNFKAEAMVFEGSFVSAGIFPEFEKELSLQPDQSLGFKYNAPPEGFPIYGGKGTFNQEISLSNDGLRGDGKLEYLTSTTLSDDFKFYPDSMNTNSQQFDIAMQTTETQYPVSHSVNNYQHWLPYADVMYIEKTDSNFTMFNDTTTLSGDLQLEPGGLTGRGKMDLKNSDIHSNEFRYKAYDIFADTSDFFLKSLHTEGYTVLTENVSSHINFIEKKGWFQSNEGYSLVNFPENKYVSFIDTYIWDMEEKTLAMGSKETPEPPNYEKEDIEPEGPRYISVKYNQDSLNFVSPLAYYDYEQNLIEATGVKFIEVADARIYPHEGLVTVEQDAKMRTLENAFIRANKYSKYHTIHSATLNISSRRHYAGMGNYDYVDENDKVQIIHFDEVKVDTAGHTVASGEIFEEADFTLSPVYHYQGKVNLHADSSLLTFRGATRIEHNCDKLQADWLYFNSPIDPDDIYIPVAEQPVNLDRNKVFNGMFLYYDSVHVYPAFITARKNYSDNPIVKSHGYLHYSKAENLYKIGSKEKINNFSLAEDYLSLHREQCKLNGEGNINLGEDLGQIKIKSYGNVRHDINANKTELDVIMAMDFYIPAEIAAVFGAEIDSLEGLEAVNLNRRTLTKTMNAWVGDAKYAKLKDELNLFGTIKELPPELKHTILFNELNLVWNDESNSYQSVGKIGIASINDIQINKKLEGFMELRIKRSGDMFDLYLMLDRRNYYYFGYTRGVMQTLSSNREYIDAIINLKGKDAKSKAGRGETPYRLIISTDRKKNNFYRRYRDILEGGEVEED